MPEVLKFLADNFNKNGWLFIFQMFILLLIVGSIAGIVIWAKNKILNDSPSNNVNVSVSVEKEDFVTEHSCHELLTHTFFRSITRMIDQEIDKLEIVEPLRAKIFKNFLKIQFNVTHDLVRDFILEDHMNDLDIKVFHSKLYALVTKIINDYEAIAIKDEIPPIVIEKFNKWHNDKIDTIYNFINDICEAGDWYGSNTVRFYSFLTQLVSMLDLTLLDARKTLVLLNGELDKVTYKGVTSAYVNISRKYEKFNF